jgi:hypothetical protein
MGSVDRFDHPCLCFGKTVVVIHVCLLCFGLIGDGHV